MSETMLQLPQGPVRVREFAPAHPSGPPIVFIHGLLADGRLWDDVVAPLAKSARCIVPDLPLGAHRVALKLTGAGYKQGPIATATDQTRTATVVAYLPGHKRDGLAVASTLKLGSGSVQPVDQSTQAVACPPPSPCAVTVVVTVGSDLASIR